MMRATTGMLVAILTLSGCGQAPAEAQKAATLGAWEYHDVGDELDDSPAKLACVKSDPDKDSSNGEPADLCLYTGVGRYRDFIGIAVEDEFDCTDCKIRVVFDDQPVELLDANRADNGKFSALILGWQDKVQPVQLRSRIVQSRRLRVEAPLADGSLRVLRFTTAGVDRTKIAVPGEPSANAP